MDNTELKLNDLLAIDRTRLAAERNLMAWIRTALSMITFGFTIYKVLQAIQAQSKAPAVHPRTAGLTLISIGTFALIAASIQHWKYVRKLSRAQPHSPWDPALIIACLLALLGFLMMGGIAFRTGPFD